MKRTVGGCLSVGAALLVAGLTAEAQVTFEKGAWKVSYDEKESVLTLDCPKREVSLSGKLSFVSEGHAWKVVEPRDATRDRLALVNAGSSFWGTGAVLGYVSFRPLGDRLEMTVLHRAGANFFPGILAFDGHVRVREDAFACRTIPQGGERILGFADGVGDSTVNDSVFAREEDLAVRFFSMSTRVKTVGDGRYAVHLEADVDDPSKATAAIEVDGAYYASRWAPGYHPINRARCPRALTGWMSWNTYFDKAGSAENLAEARLGAKYLKPFGLDIWSIESWQDNSEWLPVANFHHHENRCFAKQFPEGMKWLADEIRKLGFRPGIWMSLFGEGDESFYAAHKDLYLHDKEGRPITNWAGRHMLDTTNPEALVLIRKLAREASEDWGYEFFKFDGMANTPRKFERPEIRACAKDPKDAKWFENAARALREGIGESKLFLGCMSDFTGTEAQFVDASRLGSDVVGCYEATDERTYPGCAPSRWCQLPVKWRNVLHQAECTFTQVFVNNIMFFTDPDTLLVNSSLELNEAQVMATVIGLPGQLMFAGDKLGELTPERMRIIQQVLPVADIRPQNLYPYAASAMLPVWNLSVTRPFGSWNVVALFNWKDEPQDIAVSARELGLDPSKEYVGFEFWRQEDLGTVKGGIGLRVPMRSVKLIALHEKAAHPQFVGDDRHVTQGAVELSDLKWDEASATYAMMVKSIAGFPFSYSVRVPDGFRFRAATAEGGEVRAAMGDALLKLTVSSEVSADVTVRAAFEKESK